MPEITTLKVSTDLLHMEAIGRHIGIICIPSAGTLLNHQVRISITHDPANDNLLGHLESISATYSATLLDAAKWIYRTYLS
jgi:hypothetical protein